VSTLSACHIHATRQAGHAGSIPVIRSHVMSQDIEDTANPHKGRGVFFDQLGERPPGRQRPGQEDTGQRHQVSTTYWACPLASDERIPDGVADHAEPSGSAGHRHKEYKDWSLVRVSGLRVDVDGRGPATAVEGDHVSVVAVDGGAEVAGRARHHRPGDTALPHAETVRISVDGHAPGAAVERERVPFAINRNAEVSRCARHCLQVAAWVDGGWLTPGGAIEGDHVGAVVDGGAEACAGTRHCAQFVAGIYDLGGAPGGPVERERVGAVVNGGTEAR